MFGYVEINARRSSRLRVRLVLAPGAAFGILQQRSLCSLFWGFSFCCFTFETRSQTQADLELPVYPRDGHLEILTLLPLPCLKTSKNKTKSYLTGYGSKSLILALRRKCQMDNSPAWLMKQVLGQPVWAA